MTRWAPYTPGQPARILTAPLEHEPIDGEGWPVEALGCGPKPDDFEREDTGPTEAIHSGLTRRDLRERERPFIFAGRFSPEGTSEIIWSAVHADLYRFGASHPIREVAIDLCLDEVVEYQIEIERQRCQMHIAAVQPDGSVDVRKATPDEVARFDAAKEKSRPFRAGDVVCYREGLVLMKPGIPFQLSRLHSTRPEGDRLWDGTGYLNQSTTRCGDHEIRHATDAERRRWEAAQ